MKKNQKEIKTESKNDQSAPSESSERGCTAAKSVTTGTGTDLALPGTDIPVRALGCGGKALRTPQPGALQMKRKPEQTFNLLWHIAQRQIIANAGPDFRLYSDRYLYRTTWELIDETYDGLIRNHGEHRPAS